MNHPIGIFDSGIGGLTVFRAVRALLPGESLIYLGDTARVPYGTKSAPTVTEYSIENTEFLLHKNVKAVVAACNTASAYAVPELQGMYKTPILGVLEPGASQAVAASRNGRIGVIGTAGTIGSGAYEATIKQQASDVTVLSAPCPLFVPLVEEGWLDRPETESIAREYLQPLMAAEIDTLILGCTHYPLLMQLIQRVVGEGVQLVDSAHAAATALRDLLENQNQLCRGDRPVARKDEFYVTDSPERFQRVGEIFLGQSIDGVIKV